MTYKVPIALPYIMKKNQFYTNQNVKKKLTCTKDILYYDINFTRLMHKNKIK